MGSLTFLYSNKNTKVPREAAGAEPVPDTNCLPGSGKQPHADEQIGPEPSETQTPPHPLKSINMESPPGKHTYGNFEMLFLEFQELPVLFITSPDLGFYCYKETL